ncbi:54S ribosomal protein L22, mitochondrial [Trapelia coarctata]|nr:54S ribosomal protein L22, mitochondrial [Trapelia coarctata]
MALQIPSRRLASSALNLSNTIPCSLRSSPRPIFIHHPQTRPLFNWLRRRRDPTDSPLDPSSKRKPIAPPASQPALTTGDLAPSSILDAELPLPETSTVTPSTPGPSKAASLARPRPRDPNLTAPALDPNPLARKRWERKILIRSLRHRFRVPKSVLLARTERQSLSKSHFLKTSIKKLGPLARQIAGKKVEDAIVQMRFSRKKAAQEVLKHLEYARDEAIVRRGMGLGGVEVEGKEGKKSGETGVQGGVVVEKSGKKRVVRDKTEMYVDQAWIGRGSYGRKPDYRARGQVYFMRPPTTSITVLLKEEATRIRLSAEKEEKRKRKKPWVPLPDRPVTRQSQYCMW